MTKSEQNKLALVTGASRGIGKAIAIDLASSGLKVIGTATTSEGASRISSYLRAVSYTHLTLPTKA